MDDKPLLYMSHRCEVVHHFPMFRQDSLIHLALLPITVFLLGGCAISNRTADASLDPRVEKTDNPAIHGEIGTFYGQSLGH